MILLVGWIGAAYAWAANEAADAITMFTRSIFVVVVVALGAALWLLLRRGAIRIVEEGIFLVIGGVMLMVLANALYVGLDETVSGVRLFSLFLWFPFIYIFVFLAYERYGALARAASLYVLAVIISAPALFSGAGGVFGEANTLGLSYISMAAIIAVLYFLTRMKDDLRQTELTAEEMKRLSETDSLTGILNRRGMEGIMERELERAESHGTPLSLVIFDLDDFKSLNDTHGHDVGDEALAVVALLAKEHLRSTDSFARWGGEEFAVLCPDTSIKEAGALAERMRIEIENHGQSGGFANLEWNLSASFGVSEYRKHDSGTSLAKRADIAMYHAKESGKNRTEAIG